MLAYVSPVSPTLVSVSETKRPHGVGRRGDGHRGRFPVVENPCGARLVTVLGCSPVSPVSSDASLPQEEKEAGLIHG